MDNKYKVKNVLLIQNIYCVFTNIFIKMILGTLYN